MRAEFDRFRLGTVGGSDKVLVFDRFEDAKAYLQQLHSGGQNGLLQCVQSHRPPHSKSGNPLPAGFKMLPATGVDITGFNYATLLGTPEAPYWELVQSSFAHDDTVRIWHQWPWQPEGYSDKHGKVYAVFYVIPAGVLKTDFPPARSPVPNSQ